MLVSVHCKKCDETGTLDVGNFSKEEIIKMLQKRDGFQCFGSHVELGSPIDYWEIDWNSLRDGSAPTEEQFLEDLRSKYEEVLTTKEISKKYEINGFAYGGCSATNKETGEDVGFLFTHSPKGERYYYR
jgi:hypothetical protein